MEISQNHLSKESNDGNTELTVNSLKDIDLINPCSFYHREINGVMEPCTLDEFAEWFESPSRIVKKTHFHFNKVHVEISSIGLGIATSVGDELPLLYETMIFGVENTLCIRSPDRESCLETHEKLARLFQILSKAHQTMQSWRRIKKYLKKQNNLLYLNYLIGQKQLRTL